MFATCLQIQITLPTNMFIASDMRVLCLGQTLLVLETNVFYAGDERLSAGDEHVENMHWSFSHTHTQLAINNFLAEFMSR